MIKYISIDENDYDYLVRRSFPENVTAALMRKEVSSGKIRLSLSNDEIDIILDSLSNQLMSEGLDEDGEINASGIYIEMLIDKFSNVFYTKDNS